MSQTQQEQIEGNTITDHQQLLKETILNDEQFIKATLSVPAQKQCTPWLKVTVRPVLLRGEKYVQFSYFDAKKDTTKNYARHELAHYVDELLSCEFKHIHLYTQRQTIQIRVTKKDKVLIHYSKPTLDLNEQTLTHDRQKKTPFVEETAKPFLQAVGIMGADGKVKADRYSKLRQIQEFVKLVSQMGVLEQLSSPLHVVDAGCGNAYLTFAFYYYLHSFLNMPTSLVGVDTRNEPLEKHREKAVQLGWNQLTFEQANIIDFRPTVQPDIMLSLHACDTATDEALAQGISWQSRLIVSVPCCHHHLQQQIERQAAPSPFAPVQRHSILKERLGDILTDSFRVLILQIMGYQTYIVQFVSSEHTAKNLLIRAFKTQQPGDPRYVQEYKDLKKFWQVTPYLETLLKEPLQELLR